MISDSAENAKSARWLKRVVRLMEGSEEKLQEAEFLRGDLPEWVQNVARELLSSLFPVAKLKRGVGWRPIGVLIGAITGLVVVLMIRTAWRTASNDIKGLLTLIGEFLVIPTFWFGGPWVSGKLLASSDPSGFLSAYLVALVITFTVIAVFPLVKIVINVGREIGKPNGTGPL
jgi:hypothetical protein